MSNFVRAARTYLASKSDLTALLGHNRTFDTFIFEDKSYFPVEGTGMASIVIQRDGSWSIPNDFNTIQAPIMDCIITVDPIRDIEHVQSHVNEYDRLDAIYEKLSKYLHTMHKSLWWDSTTRIVSSARLNEPIPRPVPEGGGSISASVLFALLIG